MSIATNKERFYFLAKLGIIESTNELGQYDIQRIDNIVDFAIENHLGFYPEQLESDEEAKRIFSELTPEILTNLK